MEISKMAKRKLLSEKMSKRLQKLAATVSAITVLVGAASGMSSWVSQHFADAVSGQISDFREEVKESNAKRDQAIARLELMNLMQNDPTNVAAIEKMARYYFHTLDGDWYATQKYSDWCTQYGGDPTIIIGVD